MTEREFLQTFVQRIIYQCNVKLVSTEQELTNTIDRFLDIHHNNYFEVEFVKKENELTIPDPIVIQPEDKTVKTVFNNEPITFKGVPIEFDKEIK